MKEQIISSLNQPEALEALYRKNKTGFTIAFNELYADISDQPAAAFWKERLRPENAGVYLGTAAERIFVLVCAFLAGLVAKLPDFFNLPADLYYPANLSFVAFPFLAAFFAWQNKLNLTRILPVAALFLIAAFYINLVPGDENSHTWVLACIHLPVLLWAATGYLYTGNEWKNPLRRLAFLRFNGDFIVICTLIVISGALFTAITFGLFGLIDINLEPFYFRYAGIWGLAAVPVVGTFIIHTNPTIVNRVSPAIAKVFAPAVLLMLVMYLTAVIAAGKDPYNDREFLILFNLLLAGVLALILFVIGGTAGEESSPLNAWVLLLLAAMAVTINGIALSAIVFRIAGMGLTPNRMAVLGSNVLMLLNLLAVAGKLRAAAAKNESLEAASTGFSRFIPLYAGWAAIVTFLFPFLWNFR